MTPIFQSLERSLDRYEAALAELRETDHLEEITPYDSPISRIILYDTKAGFLLDEIPSADLENGLIDRYERSSTETQSVLETAEYRGKARSELQTRIDQFPKTVCYFHEFDPVPNEVELAVNRRDAIEMYLDKLADHYDLYEQQIRMDTLDDVFRCRYEMYIDDIQEYAVELPYYPDSYWWRHPSKIADERESTE